MAALPTLAPAMLAGLPEAVRRPDYDRSALAVGMAHVGVGAFHRCHQAEFTDDVLARRFDRWGVVGINIRPPRLGETLGRQDGLYTRLLRDGETVDARIIGCMVRTVDSQAAPEPAVAALSAPEIDVITLTITEKGYCHIPASGALDRDHPDIVHDLAHPDAPVSLPGILVRALERRMTTHGRPVTVVSCDNIPSNGAILASVVGALSDHRPNGLAAWIAAHVSFPSTMVDRIVPATSEADQATIAETFGYRDRAPVVGEPFRQWVIEDRFAARAPQWDIAGATWVDDVAPYELLKMRVLNAAQSSLCYLGLLAGYNYSCEDAADPVLADFVTRMLIEESVPTLPPVPGMAPASYVDLTFRRLRNTAIRHRNHQIATDGSRKMVQRIINPIREQLARGARADRLTLVVASWIVYLMYASRRFGRRWAVEDPLSAQVAEIADRVGRDGVRLADEIVAIEAIFDRALFEQQMFRTAIAGHLDGLLSDQPIAYVRDRIDGGVAAVGNI